MPDTTNETAAFTTPPPDLRRSDIHNELERARRQHAPRVRAAINDIAGLIQAKRPVDAENALINATLDALPLLNEAADHLLARAIDNASALLARRQELLDSLSRATHRAVEDLLDKAQAPPEMRLSERVNAQVSERLRTRLRSHLPKSLPYPDLDQWWANNRDAEVAWCSQRALNGALRAQLMSDPDLLQQELDRAWVRSAGAREQWLSYHPGDQPEQRPPTVGPIPARGRDEGCIGEDDHFAAEDDAAATRLRQVTMFDRTLTPRLKQLLQPGGTTERWLRLQTWPQTQQRLSVEADRVAHPRGLLHPETRRMLKRAEVLMLAVKPELVLEETELLSAASEGPVVTQRPLDPWKRLVSAAARCRDLSGSDWLLELSELFGAAAPLYAQAVSPDDVAQLHTSCELREVATWQGSEVAEDAVDAWYPNLVRDEQLGDGHDLTLAELDRKLAGLVRDLRRTPAYTTRPSASIGEVGDGVADGAADSMADAVLASIDSVQRLHDFVSMFRDTAVHEVRGAQWQRNLAVLWRLLEELFAVPPSLTLNPEGEGKPVDWESLLSVNPQQALLNWVKQENGHVADGLPAAPAQAVQGARAAAQFLDWVALCCAEGRDLAGDRTSWSVLHAWLSEECHWTPPAPAAEQAATRQRLLRSRRHAAGGDVVWALFTALPVLLLGRVQS